MISTDGIQKTQNVAFPALLKYTPNTFKKIIFF